MTRVRAQAVERGEPLRDALLAEPAVTEHLPPDELDAALDPGGYLGCATEFVGRALARHVALTRPPQEGQSR